MDFAFLTTVSISKERLCFSTLELLEGVYLDKMTSASVFCCLRGCLDGFTLSKTVSHIPRENPVQLDTAFMGL